MHSVILRIVATGVIILLDRVNCFQRLFVLCKVVTLNRNQKFVSNDERLKLDKIQRGGWLSTKLNRQLFTANDNDLHSIHNENIIDTGISVSASTELPFSSEIAFDAFQDPIRQPSWSTWLKSVEYIDEVDSPDMTKWTIGILGLRFSWTAKHTKRDRENGIIEWQSTTGLLNRGRVTFQSINTNSTKMNISMSFVTPRIVTRLLGGKKKAIQRLVEERMLGQTLENFREVVLRNDIPLTQKQKIEI
jgi:uncharacterized membrane protein